MRNWLALSVAAILVTPLMAAPVGALDRGEAALIASSLERGSGGEDAIAPERLRSLQHLLSVELGIADAPQPPHIVFASEAAMRALRYRDVPGDRLTPAGAALPEIVAIYDDEAASIYLPLTWNGDSPADQSILVHELVHHLQRAAHQNFACPEEREAAAFEVQERWLALFDTDLGREFGIDPFTRLARTLCLY
jgi:Domain of unknown function (DUF6647)